MACPSCGQRKGRRECPALNQRICTICCGTKRLVEIECPETCSHLAAAREHPAAAVKRQQERDVTSLLPSISHLTERQHQLYFLFHNLIARHKPAGFSRLIDDDVAQAAAAVAATIETASRGVVYEHTPASATAKGLAREIVSALAEMRAQGTKVYDGEVAIVLRAIERGARDAHTVAAGEDAYLALIGRLLHVRAGQEQPGSGAVRATGSLIVP
jgi:hypothetical protein